MPKISHTLREERRHTSLVRWRGYTNTTNERLERVIQKISEFYFKNPAKTPE
jgi:hypothetical protein